ncbi:adhesion G protein-coupled receptor L3 [Elysia marginata]|uniref:Adhesion G protein-coupled receptor L3 n=1 Tax=Elysia marginata TaxID=1093978 RepID=A0AAV4IIF3_9GAST|nr:adhesion G protein-coupled receptor L3 [Elysia marginata]
MSLSTLTKGGKYCRVWHPCFRLCLLLVFACLAVISVASEVREVDRHVCEDETLLLECPSGQILRISRAVFGRFTKSLCNLNGQLDMDLRCNAESSTDVLASRCDGRQICTVPASVDLFRNPCPGTPKYLQAYYSCEPETTEPPHRPHPDLSAVGTGPGSGIDPSQWRSNSQYDGSPAAPILRDAVAVNSTAVEIKWWTSNSPSIKDMRLYFKPYLSGLHHMTTLERTRSLRTDMGAVSEIVGDLQPSTTYVMYLKCSNDRGVSPDSNNLTVTTLALERIPTTTTTTTRKPPGTRDKGGHDLFPGMNKPERIFPKTTTPTPASRTSTTEEPGLPTDNHPPPYTDGGAERRGPAGLGRDGNSNRRGPAGIKMCPARVYRGVHWPETRSGSVAREVCPPDTEGLSSWRCVGVNWASQGPDLSECISPWLSSLDNKVTNMIGEEPMTAMKALQDGIKKEGDRLLPGDLKKVAYKILPKLARRVAAKKGKRQKELKQFQEAVVWTCSQLLAESHQASWSELSTRDCRRSATSLVEQLEKTGFEVADNLNVGDTSVAADSNVVMKASRLDTQSYHSDLTFPSPGDLDSSSPAWRGSSNSITIPSTSLKIAGRTGPLSVVFTVYNNLEDLMKPQQQGMSSTSSGDGYQEPYASTSGSGSSSSSSSKIRSRDAGSVNTVDAAASNEPTMFVNSKIIAASMGSSGWLKRLLPEPVRFTLQHLHPRDNARPLCSYWQIDTPGLSGHWSQEGCRLVYGNRSHTECECDHLTNFAVLMDITGVELPEEHELALRVITYVGCIISIVCLLLAWITFTIFKNLQCDRNTIHKNLVLTLLLAEVLFVGGIAQTQPRLLCALVAGGLHYLFLSAFAWMCLEGVQLYVMLVQVFEHERSRVNSYYLFGYGVPVIVVAVSAAVYHQGYGTEKHCWLTTDHYFVMSFVGPALAVVLINVVMLSIAIYTMCRHSNMSATMKERSKVNKFGAWLKGAVVLVVLLGLTWAFGLLYLSKQTVAWAYVFTVLNSLQGLFIFVFHCLKNDKVQKEYRKVARHTTWLPNCIRVNYGGYNLRASSSRPNSNGSGNYLSKLFGTKRRSAASTNSSAKPFLSTDQQRKSDIDTSGGSRCSANCESANIPPPSPHPTLLNGYVYNPSSYAHLNGYTSPSINNGNGVGCVVVAPHTNNGCSQHHMHQLAPCYEEVVGELSQVLDCSVVDSEMVTEYCQNNLKVNQEKPRYSTGSEDSVRLLPTLPQQPPPFLDPDNLSTVSMASSSLVHSSTQALPSTGSFPSDQPTGGEGEMEPLYEEVRVMANQALGTDTGGGEPERFDPSLNLRQYIIPSSRHGNSGALREDGFELSARRSPSSPDLQFHSGISDPSLLGRGDLHSQSQLSTSNPISFNDSQAAGYSKASDPNGTAVSLANTNSSMKNLSATGSQPRIPSTGPGSLVVSCTGPKDTSSCQSKCDLQPWVKPLANLQASSDC